MLSRILSGLLRAFVKRPRSPYSDPISALAARHLCHSSRRPSPSLPKPLSAKWRRKATPYQTSCTQQRVKMLLPSPRTPSIHCLSPALHKGLWKPIELLLTMSLLGKWIYGLPAWFMNVHSTSNRRAGGFIPSAMQDSELFWSKRHWFCRHDWFKPEELQQDHTRTLQLMQVRGIFCHQTPSLKPGKLEDFYPY